MAVAVVVVVVVSWLNKLLNISLEHSNFFIKPDFFFLSKIFAENLEILKPWQDFVSLKKI